MSIFFFFFLVSLMMISQNSQTTNFTLKKDQVTLTLIFFMQNPLGLSNPEYIYAFPSDFRFNFLSQATQFAQSPDSLMNLMIHVCVQIDR